MRSIVSIILSLMCAVLLMHCGESGIGSGRNSPPVAQAKADPKVGINDPIVLHGTGTDNGSITEYAWKFGNFQWRRTSTGDTTIIAPAEPQTYICSLRVTDNDGLLGYDAVIISVVSSPPKIPIVEVTPSPVGLNDSIYLYGEANDHDGKIFQFAWKINNGSWLIKKPKEKFDSLNNVTIIYSDTSLVAPSIAQTAICSLRVMDDDNLYSYFHKGFEVISHAPIAIITAPPQVTVGSAIDLHGRASDNGRILQWEWKFGTMQWMQVSPTTDTTCDTTIIAPSIAQIYTCSLRVRDEDNEVGITGKNIFIESSPPIPDAGPNIVAAVNSQIPLHATALDPNGEIVKWEWKFGILPWKQVSGGPDACDTTIIAPSQPGTMVCSLRVTDNDGEIGLDVKIITLKTPNLIADAGPDISTGLNDQVLLKGSGQGDNPIVQYEWKINNYPWRVTNPETTVVSAPSEQIWLCSLRVTDNTGFMATDVMTLLSRSNPPLAEAWADEPTVPINGTVHLHGKGTDIEGIQQYWWRIGDSPVWKQGPKDTTVTAPATPGSFICSLKVVDMDWEEGFDAVKIVVTSSSVIAYAGRDTVVGHDVIVKLHGQELSGATINEWWWKIGQNGRWVRTSTSDTSILTPNYDTQILCSLQVVTATNEIGKDDIRLFVKDVKSQQLVYSRSVSGTQTIFTNDSTFSNEIRVTTGESPKWSPDGQKIAFHRSSSGTNYIYVIDHSGTNEVRLTNASNGRYPSWFSNGLSVAYERDNANPNRRSVYRINIDNTGNQEVFYVTGTDQAAYEPCLNPTNNSEIGFFQKRESNSDYYRDVMIHRTSGNTLLYDDDSRYKYNIELHGDFIMWDERGRTNSRNYLKILQVSNPSNERTIYENTTWRVRGVFVENGNKIFFINTNTGNSTTYLFECNLDGSNQRQLGSINFAVENFDAK